MNQLQAVQACQLVYDFNNLEALQHLLGWDSYAPFEDDETCAVYGYRRDAQHLIFRGTFSGAGWIMDIDFIPETNPDFPGKIHRGFSRGFRDFQKWFSDHYNPSLHLFCAGHSLGGAMATLCGFHYDPFLTYTFGCPRVGNAEFAAAYKKDQVRFVNDLDPVPHLPAGPHFTHVCPETHVGSSWFSALLQHLSLGFHGAVQESIHDHYIEDYVNALS